MINERKLAEELHELREENARTVVDGLAEEEVERRKWCIEQATYEMETNTENFIKVAEKIYDYVYGKRP